MCRSPHISSDNHPSNARPKGASGTPLTTHPTLGNTVLSFPDGTTMTLVGIATVDQTFFK
jgi:hypothetical protein